MSKPREITALMLKAVMLALAVVSAVLGFVGETSFGTSIHFLVLGCLHYQLPHSRRLANVEQGSNIATLVEMGNPG